MSNDQIVRLRLQEWMEAFDEISDKHPGDMTPSEFAETSRQAGAVAEMRVRFLLEEASSAACYN